MKKVVNTEKMLSMLESYEHKREGLKEQALGKVEELVQAELEKITPGIRDNIVDKLSAAVDAELLAEKAAIIDECVVEVDETVDNAEVTLEDEPVIPEIE